MPGPAPKGSKRRRNADRFTPEQVVTGSYTSAPALPSRNELDDRTVRWWDTWAVAPQAALFTVTDWQRLLMLVPMVERYYRAVDNPAVKSYTLVSMLGEIRQSESLLGATHIDRLRGRIKVERNSEPAGPSGDVAVLDDYRAMLEDG